MNRLQKLKSRMGCSDWHTAMHSLSLHRLCGSTALGIAELERMNGQKEWQAQQTSHLVCSLAGQRCLEAWGTLWTWTGQGRSIDRLKERGTEKGNNRRIPFRGHERSVFNQTNNCFVGNFGETAGWRGRARMGLIERSYAILSRNWNWHLDLLISFMYWPTVRNLLMSLMQRSKVVCLLIFLMYNQRRWTVVCVLISSMYD